MSDYSEDALVEQPAIALFLASRQDKNRTPMPEREAQAQYAKLPIETPGSGVMFLHLVLVCLDSLRAA